MIRVATLADLKFVEGMAWKFLEVSGYKDYGDQETVSTLVMNVLTGDPTKVICIIDTDGGMIAGTVTKFPFGNHFLSTELAWWVEPELRKTGMGRELLGAFEHWAKEIANTIGVVMVSLDDDLGKFYEKNGYKLHERAYMKVF